MGIVVHWDDDQQTILRWDFEGAWNWDDFYTVQAEVNDLSSKAEHFIDVIANMQNTMMLPSGALSQFGRIAKASKERSGVTVVVGANRFIETMLNIFGRFQRDAARRILTASSLEEARTILLQRRESSEGQGIRNG